LYTSPAFLNDTVYIAAPQRCSPTYTRLLTPARRILVSFVALAALSASADEQRVYHVDAYGDVPYGKPSYKVSGDGRVVEVDAPASATSELAAGEIETFLCYSPDCRIVAFARSVSRQCSLRARYLSWLAFASES